MQDIGAIAIIGGTGDLGSGLANIWTKAGRKVIVGSRSTEKAQQAARELSARYGCSVLGACNADAAREAAVVVIAVPYASHGPILRELKDVLAGKIVVDAVVPLAPPKVSQVSLPERGSAALEARDILGPEARLASAFHNVGAKKLLEGEKASCDVLVFADDKETRDVVVAIAGDVGAKGVAGGSLANSVAAEAMTSVLIWINRAYKVSGAGVTISGLSDQR